MITWLEKAFNFSMGCLMLLIAALSFVLLLPFIIIFFICLLTPPPFTMIINLIFPLFYFMGPNGARTCLDGLLSALHFLVAKASFFFRTARELTL